MNIQKKVFNELAAAILICVTLTTTTQAVAADRVRLKMATINSSTLKPVGSLGKSVSEKIRKISDGSLQLRWAEPGALVPPMQTFDAVSKGSIDASWSNAGYWTGKDVAFAMFAAVPFGPRAPEYLAWMYYGGGQKLMEELYAKYNIHPVSCGVTPPEGGGWFKKEISSLDDLKGLKMRILGLGASTLEKLGVSTQLLASAEIYNALELGVIDATEFSMPSIDKQLGFDNVAKYYYFPGWHQQSTLYNLLINNDVWDELSDTHQAQIQVACGDNFREGLALGGALQANAIRELKKEGVNLRKFPPAVMEGFRKSWQEVASELQDQSPEFAKIWKSYSSFHEAYKNWAELGYLD